MIGGRNGLSKIVEKKQEKGKDCSLGDFYFNRERYKFEQHIKLHRRSSSWQKKNSAMTMIQGPNDFVEDR